ncbi:MAG: FAD-binding protein, partial [Planctomycetota bacterium]|nr:FAD-binding protein [Planctomycetota bacterium]
MSWYRGCEEFVSENVPLARMTSYRVGGPARFLAAPPDEAALSEVLSRAADAGLPVRSLGHGSNLLAADAGVDGMIVRLPRSGFGSVERVGTSVRVGSAHSLSGLVKWSVAQGLRGLECLYGIPGTVGAALRMNSGGKHGEIGARVRRVRGVERDGTAVELRGEQCGFSYRNSGLNGRIVTGCELELEEGDPAAGEALITRI